MAKWKFKKVAAWSALAFLIVMACMAAGCNRNGTLLPINEWFAPADNGSTPYNETTEPVRDIAGLFGPIGDAVALGIAGIGLVGTGVYRTVAKSKGAKVRKVGPVAQKLIYNIAAIKRERPDLWKQMEASIAAGMNGGDKAVINHFRPDKDTNLKTLRGVEG
jgi:hypothetical protein